MSISSFSKCSNTDKPSTVSGLLGPLIYSKIKSFPHHLKRKTIGLYLQNLSGLGIIHMYWMLFARIANAMGDTGKNGVGTDGGRQWHRTLKYK